MPRGGLRPGAGRPRDPNKVRPVPKAARVVAESSKPAAKARVVKPKVAAPVAPKVYVDMVGGKVDHAPKSWPFGVVPEDKREPVEPPAPPVVVDLSKLSPLDYLLSIVRDPLEETRTRIQAATQAAPYCHVRPGDVGKKDAKQQAAEKVASKFAAKAPPKLIVNNAK
jgi:phage terminase small subunit